MDLEEIENRIVKDCPKCNFRVKFHLGDKSVKCKKCKREYLILRDETKDEKDPESYTFSQSQSSSLVDLVGRIAFIMMLVASVAMIGFAIYAKHKMTDGLEDNTGGYTLTN